METTWFSKIVSFDHISKILKAKKEYLVRSSETPNCVTTNYYNSFVSNWLQNNRLAKWNMRQKSFEFRQLIKSCIEVLLYRKLENVVETIPIQSNDDNGNCNANQVARCWGRYGEIPSNTNKEKKILFQK